MLEKQPVTSPPRPLCPASLQDAQEEAVKLLSLEAERLFGLDD